MAVMASCANQAFHRTWLFLAGLCAFSATWGRWRASG